MAGSDLSPPVRMWKRRVIGCRCGGFTASSGPGTPASSVALGVELPGTEAGIGVAAVEGAWVAGAAVGGGWVAAGWAVGAAGVEPQAASRDPTTTAPPAAKPLRRIARRVSRSTDVASLLSPSVARDRLTNRAGAASKPTAWIPCGEYSKSDRAVNFADGGHFP